MSGFTLKHAERTEVPLWVGLAGPSGCGKTFSALRVATGIQQVTGGKIGVADTETRRALHYADRFDFEHLEFKAPFGALRYLEAASYMVEQGCRVIVIDSMSHEHEGEGGLLDSHDKEWQRLGRKEATKFLAWVKPKQDRQKLINGLLQLDAHFIFCFRAKQGVKPVKRDGKTDYVQQGFQPISGEQFLFEQTVCCVLPPNSGGVPVWESEYSGERMYMKLPVQFRDLFGAARPLDEDHGRQLAEWAKGGEVAAPEPELPQSERKKLFAEVGNAAKRLGVDRKEVEASMRAEMEGMGIESTKQLDREGFDYLYGWLRALGREIGE